MFNKLNEIYNNLDKKYGIKKYTPVILYLFFGVVTTLTNILVYALLARAFKLDYTVSNIVAWVASIIVAYVTNKIYVFKSGADTKKGKVIEVFKFFIMRLITLGIDMGIMYIGISIIHLDDIIVKCIANAVVIITNYFCSKYLVFISKKKES